MESIVGRKVLERIKSHEVSMRPKWIFWIFDALVYGALILALLIGALSLGIAFELFDDLLLHKIFFRPGGITLILFGLPYIWLIMLVIFLPVALAEFLRTRNGYRYRLRNVALIFLAIIFFFSLVFYASGFTDNVEKFMEKNVPGYSHLIKTPGSFWFQPEKGLLSGTIILEDDYDETLELEDMNGVVWDIDYSAAKIRSKVEIEDGEKVKIIGDHLGEYNFKAKEIDPWTYKRAINNKESEAEHEISPRG